MVRVGEGDLDRAAAVPGAGDLEIGVGEIIFKIRQCYSDNLLLTCAALLPFSTLYMVVQIKQNLTLWEESIYNW